VSEKSARKNRFNAGLGLRLSVSGVEHSKWTEGGGRSSVTFQGERIIINNNIYFFGSKDNQDTVEIPQGTHSYNHSIRLPHAAPGSIEGKHGFIRYKVVINLDIPFMPDLTSEAPFTVARSENLNFYPELKLANETEEARTFCCFVCETEPIMVRLSSAQSGFIPGETITVKVEIFNKSNVAFPKSTISFNRVENFQSYTPLKKTKSNTVTLLELKSKGVEAKKNRKFEEELVVPQEIDMSNDRICDIFQVTYEVRFLLKQAKNSTTIHASIPIYIGKTTRNFVFW
jgi:Arrestin (or S-antigen), C-terminal domain/Arrestin (or S-antigen), N-terminal domain